MTSNRPTRPDREILNAFVDLAGPDLWLRRLAEIRRQAQVGPRAGKAILNRQIAAYTVERLRKGLPVAREADVHSAGRPRASGGAPGAAKPIPSRCRRHWPAAGHRRSLTP